MKKLSTISLFIFGIAVVAILIVGLVFRQNNKNNQTLNENTKTLIQNTVKPPTSSKKSLILNMTEISKHNNENDCWMLISGKVYDVTSYFGYHPGGNGTMAATCGTDATDAYMTKDPNATSAGGRSAHSSRAQSLLTQYYIGNFNQTL